MQLSVAFEKLSESRSKRLYDELSFAVSRTDGAVLRQWGGRSAGRLVTLGARRIGGLAALVAAIGTGTWSELRKMIRATGQGSALELLGDRWLRLPEPSVLHRPEARRSWSVKGSLYGE